jgi:hypothetical protein
LPPPIMRTTRLSATWGSTQLATSRHAAAANATRAEGTASAFQTRHEPRWFGSAVPVGPSKAKSRIVNEMAGSLILIQGPLFASSRCPGCVTAAKLLLGAYLDCAVLSCPGTKVVRYLRQLTGRHPVFADRFRWCRSALRVSEFFDVFFPSVLHIDSVYP